MILLGGTLWTLKVLKVNTTKCTNVMSEVTLDLCQPRYICLKKSQSKFGIDWHYWKLMWQLDNQIVYNQPKLNTLTKYCRVTSNQKIIPYKCCNALDWVVCYSIYVRVFNEILCILVAQGAAKLSKFEVRKTCLSGCQQYPSSLVWYDFLILSNPKMYQDMERAL